MITAFFETPTVADFTRALGHLMLSAAARTPAVPSTASDGAGPGAAAPDPDAEVGEARRVALSFAQRRLWFSTGWTPTVPST